MVKNTPKAIVIHCSDVSEKAVFNQLNSINTYHRDTREFPKSSLGYFVGYHYLITGNMVYQCRLDTDEGAHCNQVVNGLSMNFQSIGVCWAGDGDVEYPSSTHYKLLQETVWKIQDTYNIPNTSVYFHRFFQPAKSCPGSLITSTWLSALLERPKVAVRKDAEQCLKQESIIAAQKKEIGLLRSILDSISRVIKNYA